MAAVWYGEPWFTILAAAFGLAAVVEFFRLGSATGAAPLPVLGAFFTLALILARSPGLTGLLPAGLAPAMVTPLLLAAAAITLLAGLARRRGRGDRLAGWAWTMAGLLYLGWLLGHAVALRGLEEGRNWLILALLANTLSDSAAFLVGRSLGRHRLAPRISPRKTWEGALAGLVAAMALPLLFAAPQLGPWANPLHIAGLGRGEAVGVGALVSIFGQAGDLVESWLKRRAGVKDSGNLFPGHGGALDRLDSVIFAVAAVYYYAWLTGAA